MATKAAKAQKGISLSGVSIDALDLSGADVRSSDFTSASMLGASFRGADLRGADFSGADLTGCDFSGARMPSESSIALDEFDLISEFNGLAFRLDIHGQDKKECRVYMSRRNAEKLYHALSAHFEEVGK